VTPLATVVTTLALYGAGVAAAAVAATWLGRRIPRGILALFALLPVLFLWEGMLRARSPLGPDQAFLTLPAPRPPGPWHGAWLADVAHQIVPWSAAVRRTWAEGSLPFRNRWNGCGAPLDGNGQSAPYSPFTLAAMLLPPLSALSFEGGLRFFLCLWGMWLWLTELAVSRRAAVFGAVAFGFSMAMTAWILFPMTAAIALWPAVLFLVERLADPSRRGRAVAALAAVLTLWPLSGHLETVVSGAAFGAVWFAVRASSGEARRVAAILPYAAGASVAALGLSAFSTLPQALAISASNRHALTPAPFWTPALSLLPHGPEWARGALLPLFPRLLGDKIEVPMQPGAAGAFPEMASGHFGILAAACLLLLLRPGGRRARAEMALAAPLLFGLGAVIGLWPFAEFVSSVPGLKLMFPLRYFVWFALAGAAIAAFELDRLERDLEDDGREILWPIAAIGALLGATYAVWRILAEPVVPPAALAAARSAFFLPAASLAAGLVVFAATGGRAARFRSFGVALLTLVSAGELFAQGRRLAAWYDASGLYAETPLIRFLQSRPLPFRIAGEGRMFFPNLNLMAGIEDVRTHDPAERRDYVEFLDATCGYDPAPYFKEIANLDASALDFLNVRYLVSFPARATPSPKWTPAYSGPDGTVFKNAAVLFRVTAPGHVRAVPAPPSREMLRALDWAHEAVVEDPSGALGSIPGENGAAEILDYAESANRVTFRVRTSPASSGAGAILVASLVNDGGWRARDESGRRLPIARADGPFLALRVPAGEHRIRLAYAAPGFRVGAFVSAAACLGILLLAMRRFRARTGAARRNSTGTSPSRPA
jgi:hypothetical protein